MIPETHLRVTYGWTPWIAEVEKQTGGRVKIIPYFAAALSSPMETFDATRTGISDIGEQCIGFLRGRFPCAEVTNYAPMGKTNKKPGRSYWEIYKKYPEAKEEFGDTKMLWLHSSSGCNLAMAKKPVRTLEDMKGLKIWVPTGAVKLVEATGATVVSFPMPDVYLGLEKGVIDGYFATNDLLIGRRHAEVVKYVTETNFSHTMFVVVMNLDTWNSLPPDIQKTMDELSGDYAVDLFDRCKVKMQDEARERSIKEFGVEFLEMPEEEMAKWEELRKPIADEFAAELEDKGLPGEEILNDFVQIYNKYSE